MDYSKATTMPILSFVSLTTQKNNRCEKSNFYLSGFHCSFFQALLTFCRFLWGGTRFEFCLYAIIRICR